MTSAVIANVLLVVVGFVLSTAVHEWAHAFTADRLGDPTPRDQGRLTLNPVAHIDPVGTLVFPAIGAALGGMLFGWARPVEFRPTRFRRNVTMRQGSMMVALAGPLSNVGLALVCGLLLKVTVIAAGGELHGTADALAQFLHFGVVINVILAIFNLVPVAPLDGFHVLGAVVGYEHPAVKFLERNRLWIFLGLIFVGFRLLAGPMQWLTSTVLGIYGLA